MDISARSFSTLVANMAASAQGACTTLLDMTVGSVLRALLESSAATALWLQFLILQVQTMTRLATSVGDDVDSWVADYGLLRLPAARSTGTVVMGCLSPASLAATVLAGTLLKTTDGTQSFVVTGGPYVRPIGTASIVVAIAATVAGQAGNVQPGAITILGTATPGIDTVVNDKGTIGGADAESDDALRRRFVLYFNSRSQATYQAVEAAILSVQQGLNFVIQENLTAAGKILAGCFTVIVDDGSGAPPSGVLNQVAAAIDKVRPIGSIFSVVGPALLAADVTLTCSTSNPKLNIDTRARISAAISAYVNGLKVGDPLRFSRLAGLAYDAADDVTNVTTVSLNGGSADLGGVSAAVVRCGVITIVIEV